MSKNPPAKENSWARASSGLRGDHALGILLLMPIGIVVFGLVAYPLGSALWMSLNEKMVGGIPRFVGLRHYAALLQDGIFRTTVANTFLYTFSCVSLKLILGISIALLLNKDFRGRNLARGFILLPWAVPALVSALMWRWMFDDLSGVLNYILLSLGIIKAPVSWLASMTTAMPSVILVSVWRGTPFFAVTLLAGLQAIPAHLYEAAEVDGASAWQKFLHVDLPGILPVAGVVTLLATIWTFNEFQVVFVLTGGGPAHATEVLSTLTYQIGIGAMRLGHASAVSLMFLPFIAMLIAVTTKWMLRKES